MVNAAALKFSTLTGYVMVDRNALLKWVLSLAFAGALLGAGTANSATTTYHYFFDLTVDRGYADLSYATAEAVDGSGTVGGGMVDLTLLGLEDEYSLFGRIGIGTTTRGEARVTKQNETPYQSWGALDLPGSWHRDGDIANVTNGDPQTGISTLSFTDGVSWQMRLRFGSDNGTGRYDDDSFHPNTPSHISGAIHGLGFDLSLSNICVVSPSEVADGVCSSVTLLASPEVGVVPIPLSAVMLFSALGLFSIFRSRT